MNAPTHVVADRSGPRPGRRGGIDALPSGRRVLIVDDNVDNADLLSELLALAGNETIVAYSGAEALTIAAAWRPDVVLLDLGLPDVSGEEVCVRLRAQPGGQRVRVVAVTGWGEPAHRAQSAAAGFDDHLVKPVRLGHLADALNALA